MFSNSSLKPDYKLKAHLLSFRCTCTCPRLTTRRRSSSQRTVSSKPCRSGSLRRTEWVSWECSARKTSTPSGPPPTTLWRYSRYKSIKMVLSQWSKILLFFVCFCCPCYLLSPLLSCFFSLLGLGNWGCAKGSGEGVVPRHLLRRFLCQLPPLGSALWHHDLPRSPDGHHPSRHQPPRHGTAHEVFLRGDGMRTNYWIIFNLNHEDFVLIVMFFYFLFRWMCWWRRHPMESAIPWRVCQRISCLAS